MKIMILGILTMIAGLVLMVLLFAINIVFEGLKKKLAKEGSL